MSQDPPGPGNAAFVSFGPFRLDRREKLLFRDGEVVPLTLKAFEMLDLLVRNAGRVVEKEPLMRGVWPDTFVDEANLSHHVFMLRRALGDDREGNRFIENIPRRGYRFVAPVIADESDADAIVIDERVRERIVIDESGAGAVPARRGSRVLILLLLLITIGALATLAFALSRARSSASEARTLRFSIEAPPATAFMQYPVTTELAVSPDGQMLAMVALEGQRRKLFVRRFDELTARAIAGSDDAMSPFWSPDAKWIGFFAGGFMKKVPLDGGPAQTICPVRGGMGSWNAAGDIIFFEWGPGSSDSIRLVHESGGAIRDLTNPKAGTSFWPSFLPDGRHFTYFALGPPAGLLVGSVDGGAPHLVNRVHSRGEVRGDDLYYIREGVLVRQKFDLKRFSTIGDPIPIAGPAFCFTPLGTANFSLSSDAAVIAWQRRMLPTQLVWRDWNGRELSRVGKPELYRSFTISPDGRRVAADVVDATTEVPAVWVFDLERGVGTRVASNPIAAASPVWRARDDTLLITYGNPSRPSDAPALSLLDLTNGSVRLLRNMDGPQYATDITADGSRVVYTVNRGRYKEIEMFPIANPAAKTTIESSPEFDASDGVLSPDNRWLAYESGESGRPEIYVRPFDRTGEKIRVSTTGGSEPQWSTAGDAIFFLSPEGMLMKSDVREGRITKETTLFPITSAGMMAMASLGQSHYAVTRDRVLTREIPGGTDADPVTVLFVRK